MKTTYLTGAMMLTTLFMACTKDASESANLTPGAPKKSTISNPVGTQTVTLGGRVQTPSKTNPKNCHAPAKNCLNGQPRIDDTFNTDIALLDIQRQTSPGALATFLAENSDITLTIFPDWNEDYMKTPKEMLLSGNYYLLKLPVPETTRFFYIITQESSDDADANDVFDNGTFEYVFIFES